MGANTVSIGAFPALLPEIGTTVHLADWQLGAVAGAFGFARMLADVPVGLFITHHLARALTVAPIFLVSGALVMATGGEFSTVLVGRVLMGTGTRCRCWPGSPPSCATAPAPGWRPH